MRIPATMSEKNSEPGHRNGPVNGRGISHNAGVTILPIFGIVVAVPVITLAFYIFRTAKWSIVEEKETETVAAETIAEHPVTA